MNEINQNCPCKKINCPRHGNCKECKQYHHSSSLFMLTKCERINLKQSFKNKLLKSKWT